MAEQRCLFCGGDPNERGHWRYCDGKQGALDAEEPEELPAPVFLARHSDPDTSHASMAALDETYMRGAADVVCQLLDTHGPMPDYLMRERFQALHPHADDSTYRQARSKARDQGRLRDSGARVENPHTGRQQILWERCHVAPVEIVKCDTCGHVLRRQAS